MSIITAVIAGLFPALLSAGCLAWARRQARDLAMCRQDIQWQRRRLDAHSRALEAAFEYAGLHAPDLTPAPLARHPAFKAASRPAPSGRHLRVVS